MTPWWCLSASLWFQWGCDVVIKCCKQIGLVATRHAASHCVFWASQGLSRVLTKNWFNVVTFAELSATYILPIQDEEKNQWLLFKWKYSCWMISERHLNRMQFKRAFFFDNVNASWMFFFQWGRSVLLVVQMCCRVQHCEAQQYRPCRHFFMGTKGEACLHCK